MQKLLVCTALVMAVSFCMNACVSAYDRPPRKPAIVLAAFGTTQPEAVEAIINILKRTRTAFPEYDVHLAFTSNMIRSVWRGRADDAAFRAENPDIPEEVYSAASVLATLANIQDTGARLVLVQSLHVTDGEEYKDLANLVAVLAEYKTMKRSLHPFPWIGVGEPALGLGDGQPRYLERAAAALRPLAEKAKAGGASLVLMGHGNEHLSQQVFARLEETLRKQNGPHIYIGTVEAEPFADDIAEAMESDGAPKKILLAPLMVVAGDHAKNDMAGGGEDSWASVFTEAGYEPEPFLQGLGMNDSWADIYIEHLRELEKKVLEQKARDDAEEDGDED